MNIARRNLIQVLIALPASIAVPLLKKDWIIKRLGPDHVIVNGWILKNSDLADLEQ